MDKLVKKVSKTVQILAKCSSPDADRAAEKICQDPEALMLLASTCGASTYLAINSFKATTAAAAIQMWPVAALSGVSTMANAYVAKRFCTAVIKQTGNKISTMDKNMLREILP